MPIWRIHMPIWRIHHPINAYTAADKAAFAAAITAWYTNRGLPVFYVHVYFVPTAADDYYNAAQPRSNFVFAMVDHVARNVKPGDHAHYKIIKDGFDAVCKPWTTDRGLHLEYNVNETHPYLWRINGIDPPESFPPEEKEQAERNRVLLKEKFGN